MIFNEQNTIENALRDHFCGSVKGEEKRVRGGVFEVREDSPPYGSSFSPQPSSFFPPWKFVHGDDLILHGKQPQDVFVDTWLKESLCRLNKPLAANSDLADVGNPPHAWRIAGRQLQWPHPGK